MTTRELAVVGKRAAIKSLGKTPVHLMPSVYFAQDKLWDAAAKAIRAALEKPQEVHPCERCGDADCIAIVYGAQTLPWNARCACCGKETADAATPNAALAAWNAENPKPEAKA